MEHGGCHGLLVKPGFMRGPARTGRGNTDCEQSVAPANRKAGPANKAVTMTILYCHCAYADVVPEETRRAVRAALDRADDHVEVVADLCGRAAEGDPLLKRLAEADAGPLHVVACYERAVRHLFDVAGTPLPGAATVHNMRTEAAETILARLGLRDDTLSPDGRGRGEGDQALDSQPSPSPRPSPVKGEGGTPFPATPSDGWVPWFPVIDYDRCVSCGQCFEFCLFGAFAVEADGRVRVAHPEKCKLNCPACARVCPASAIVFPKFPDGGPIAGGEGTLDADAEDGMRTDLDRLGRADVYETLRRRADQARTAARAKAAARRAGDQPEDASSE